ncbi:MAG: ABC transporter permease [Pseudomonadota bacterium]
MRRAALLALLSHWRRQPLQLIALLFGLAAATALWTGVQAINSEARASYDDAASALGQGNETRLLRRDGGPLSPESFVSLRRAGWLVSPVVEGSIGGATLLGIDPFTLPPTAASPNLADGDRLERFLSAEGLILAHPDTDLPTGLPVETAANIPIGQATTDITTAWRLLDREDFSYLVLSANQPAGLTPLAQLAPQLQTVTIEAGGDIGRLTRSFHLNLTAFGLLSFAVGLFITHATIGLAFEQRRAMFRTLRALGTPSRTLTGLLAAETALFATLAGLIGVALGYWLATLLLPGVAATLGGLYGASVPGTLTLSPSWALSGMAIAYAGASAAAAASLWRVANLPILAPTRPRAWALASAKSRIRQAIIGVLLLGLAALIAAQGHGIVAGFAMLGALLFGAALLLPLALDTALALAQRFAKTPVLNWAIADTRQQLPGLSLALMALLLALATNIGVGTMVSSFRATFTGWIEQRLASEIYITAQTPAQAEAARMYLETEADAVLPVRRTNARIAGAPAQIIGVVDHPTYAQGWPLITASADPWRAVATGKGALVNEQLWRREGLALGDTITLLPGWELPLVGVYSDYGNPEGQAITSLAALQARVPDLSPLRYSVRTDPARIPELRAGLEEIGLPSGNIVDQVEVKDVSLAIFERTFLVTGALNLLTLGVAACALLTALTTLATMRLPQLAPVWAMGLTRRRLAGLELGRSAVCAALTFVLALPLGLAVAWALLAVVNVQAFGWRLPLLAFPLDWARLALLALLAALAAALLPAIRLARIDPSRLLKVFADER